MNEQPRYSVPEPCQENWNEMTPQEQGRFCKLCTKVVHDFTDKPLAEVHAVMDAGKPGEVCGRFHRSQLIQPIEGRIIIHKPVPSVLRRFVLALVTVFGLSFFGVTTAHAQTPSIATDVSANDSIVEIGGIVSDTLNPGPLEGVTVLILRFATPIAGAVTNSEGKFRIRIPASKLGDEPFDIRVMWNGYTKLFGGMDAGTRDIAILLKPEKNSILSPLFPPIQIISGGGHQISIPTRDIMPLMDYIPPVAGWDFDKSSEIKDLGRW